MADPSFDTQKAALIQQLKDVSNQKERERLLLELADLAVQNYDPTDSGYVEEYHQFFEDYRESRLDYRQTGFRLGRLIMSTVEDIPQALKANTN